MTIIDRAREFAVDAHDEQKRRYTGEPYVSHCDAVVAILRSAGITDETTIAAAFLHDVLEDAPVTFYELERAFGSDIAGLVSDLTDYGPGTGNRAKRKAMDRERLSRAPAKAQTIKVADMIDNTSSIVEHDPDFAVTYMREKALLLPLLTKADEGLLRRAAGLLADYENRGAITSLMVARKLS
jgi:(p)ppGpp synthase/HD superfamily hydrolase